MSLPGNASLRRKGTGWLAVIIPLVFGAAETSAQATSTRRDLPTVLATIADERITMDDIRASAGEELDRLDAAYQRDRHKLINAKLQQILRERVVLREAKLKGWSVDELVAREAGGTLDPTDAEIEAWFQQNPQRLGGRTLAQMRAGIAKYLRTQRYDVVMKRLERRLQEEGDVTVNLEPYRVLLEDRGEPGRGPANAPITIVEFSDFQCPFCGAFSRTLAQVEKTFGDSIRIVYRQFPLDRIHPNAQKAAEASLCAAEQGRFWEMHDLMFAEQTHLTVSELKEKADRADLDRGRFDECLDSGRHVEQIERDRSEGLRLGVTGTPAVFVNGIPIEGGAVSFEVISGAILDELRRIRR
jgi:protein-disulfide isomerase